MKKLFVELKIAVIAVLSLGVLVCAIYPAVIWGLAQALFPFEANGSMVGREGRRHGSYLVGQGFATAKYFHPRPSAAGTGYDALNSGGSNLGPTSRKLIETVKQRISEYRAENGLGPDVPIPADAVTASASGLDPHISVQNARLQAPRVAKARGRGEDEVFAVIARSTEDRYLGILGEPRVHVLKLNMMLDVRGD
ncbi:MAG TPA: K(+)-transporting ATPase subunit C [Syntrophorhabdaceae bacterium]|jgi:K+-transporting ATPase ATPase C chain